MSEWKKYKLGQLAEVLSSKRIFYNDYVDEGIPFFRSKEIIEKTENKTIEEPLFISEEKFRKIKEQFGTPSDGDVLISSVGVRSGIPYLVNNDGEFYFKDGNLIWLRNFKDALNSKFLCHWIKSEIGQFELQNMMIGSAQPALTISGLRQLSISIPSSHEQKAIAEVLSSLDEKIDLLHRQNQTLEAMAETLFRQWFVKEAKEDWEEGVLSDEFDFTMGQSPPGSSFNNDRIGTPMFQGNADFGFRFPKERVFTTEPKRFAEPLDTLISVRAPVGAQNMAEVRCCIGRGVASFRHKNKSFYTYTYFKLRSLMNGIKLYNEEGTVFGSISKSDFKKIKILIPPKDIILDFEDKAKPINDKIIKNCLQIRTLVKLRDTLLPKLMSGEVRINQNE